MSNSDWRVAGALMEKCESTDTWWNRDHKEWCAEAWLTSMETAIRKQNESLPRAIIEACTAALETDHE